MPSFPIHISFFMSKKITKQEQEILIKNNNITQKNITSNKDEKEQFLFALQENETLSEALEFCGLTKSKLCTFLFKDKTFQKNFDKIINLKLEIALLETALKSRASNILTFSLINRLPKKYNKSKKEKSSEQAKQNGLENPQEIIFMENDNEN